MTALKADPHRQVRQICIIKQITTRLSDYEPFLGRAHLLNSLYHPTLFHPLYVSGRQSSPDTATINIFSSIVEPGGLNNLIAQPNSNRKWTSTTPVIILYGVATALKLLHSVDCPHGSVSLGNVLLNESLEPSLSDSAVWPTCDMKINSYSVYIQEHKRSRVDRLFSVAPEETAQNTAPTKATDVYEFGCLFYMLLKKGAPFLDRVPFSTEADIRKYLESRRAPVTDGLPPIAVDLIGKCCNAKPTSRPTIEEIISIIEKNPTKLGFAGVDQNAFKAYVDRIARSLPRVNKPASDVGGGGVISAGPISKAEYLERLVRAGSASAAFFLGAMFESGDSVEKDIGKALNLYRQSGEGGCPFGNLRAGLLLRETDPELASKYFELAGAAGNSDGLNELGQLTESGAVKGGAQAAAKLYGKAAFLGNESARRNYARCLAHGIGVPANPRLAARFQGDAKGKSGAPNEEDAVARGLGFVAEGAFEKAAAEFRIAAAAGSGDALFSLGWLVEQGRIDGNAEEFYREAVNRGSARAQNNLGVILVRSGRKEEGYELIGQAARQGDAYGMNNIAVGIENGDYPGDIQVVAGLYRDAAARGVVDAIENYAAAIAAGIGIERNDAEAQYYLEKAKQKRAAS